MSDKKPFKDTKFWKFVTEKIKPVAGDVLEIVGDVTGIGAIEKVGELLNDRKENDAQVQALAIEFERMRHEFEMDFLRLEMETFKLEVEDKQSARSREVEFMKTNGGKRDWLMGAAVITALAMYIGAFAFLAFGPVVPQEKKDLFNMGVGQVFTFAGMAFAYYLGTTKQSRMKDETIRQINESR